MEFFTSSIFPRRLKHFYTEVFEPSSCFWYFPLSSVISFNNFPLHRKFKSTECILQHIQHVKTIFHRGSMFFNPAVPFASSSRYISFRHFSPLATRYFRESVECTKDIVKLYFTLKSSTEPLFLEYLTLWFILLDFFITRFARKSLTSIIDILSQRKCADINVFEKNKGSDEAGSTVFKNYIYILIYTVLYLCIF